MTDKANPLAGIEPTEKGERTLGRIKERFNVESLPAALEILAGSENGIHDLYMNLNRQLKDGQVTEKVKLLVAVGVASAVGSGEGVQFFSEAAIAAGWSREETLEAVSVANTAAVFNDYYRFRHQIPDSWRETYDQFKAPFNANTFMKTSLAQADMEAICIVVSSVNNCHACVHGHVKKGKTLGLTDEQVDELIKAGSAAASASLTMKALSPQATGTVSA